MNIETIASDIYQTLESGKKLLVCGNGGSSVMAAHFVGELVCTFQDRTRKGYRALNLSDNPAILTAWSNDFCYDDVFARQVRVWGDRGDILMVLSTSGKSKSCLNAIIEAQRLNMKVIDLPRVGKDTAQIQENHLKYIHDICRYIDEQR